MIELKAEYRGYVIEWGDWKRQFIIKLDGIQAAEKKTLDECEKWIDAKFEEEFKQVKVFWRSWRGDILNGVATSFDGEDVWVTADNGKRSKGHSTFVYVDTASNQKMLGSITEKENQIDKLNAEIEELIEQLEHITRDHMIITKTERRTTKTRKIC